MVRIYPLAITLLLLALPLHVHAQDHVAIESHTSQRLVAPADSFTYHVEVSVEGNYDIHVDAEPDFGPLRVESTFRAPSFTIRNGQATRSLQLRYQLRAPRDPGSYEIRPPRIVVGSRTFTPPPRTVQVSENAPQSPTAANRPTPSPPSAPNQLGSDVAILDIELDPERAPFVGEQITARYNLYVHQRHRGMRVSFPDEPDLDDFWVHDISESTRGPRNLVHRDGQLWEVTPIRVMALFPLRPGPSQVDAFNVNLHRVGFFTNDEEFLVPGSPLSIDVRPLPDGAPDGFSEHNIGSWSLHVQPDSNSARVGGSLMLTARINGIGRPARLSPPTFDETDAFRLVNQNDTFDETLRGSRIAGTRTFTFHFMPLKEGPQTLPPLRFVYFDPDQEQYIVLESDPVQIRVEPGELPEIVESSPAADTADPPSYQPLDELHALLPDNSLGPARSAHPHLPLWVFLLPLTLLVLLGLEHLWRHRSARIHGERKRREALLARLLAQLDQHPETEHCLKVLREALNSGLHLSLGALTTSEVREASATTIDDPALQDRLITLVDRLINTRYAPTESPQRRELVHQTRQILPDLLLRTLSVSARSSAATMLILVTTLLFLLPDLASAENLASPETPPNSEINWSDQARELASRADTHQDPTLDYNAGTAFAHAGDLGQARFYLERATLRGAQHPSLRTNLDLVTRAVAVSHPSVANFPYQTIEKRGFVTFALWLTTLSLWLALILAILLRYFLTESYPHRGLLKSGLIITLILTLLGTALLFAFQSYMGKEVAILTSETTLFDSPSTYGETIDGLLPPGTIMHVQEFHTSGWHRVELPSGSRGWIPADHLRLLPP